jgi:type IV pilus assembly protein PilC
MTAALRQRCHFTRQLATLMAAGLPLLESLTSMAKSEPSGDMRQLIVRLSVSLEQGCSFHLALRQSNDFDTLYCELVAAAEMAGNLDQVLERLALLLEKRQTLQSQIRTALAYPCAVLLITMVVVTVIMVWVVPVFEGVFSSLGADLPALTLSVVQMSRWITNDGAAWVLLAISVLYLPIRLLMAKPDLQLWRDTTVLRLPLLGAMVHQSQLALWTLTLSDLLKAGVPMLDALEVVAASSTNRCIGISTIVVRAKISHGASLAAAMESLATQPSQAHVFPTMLIQLVDVGEQSGALDALLAKVAQQLNTQVDNLLRQFTQLLEPAMMVVLGLLMGGLVVALYLPVFQLGQVL